MIYLLIFQSLDKVGDLLVGFFLESFENSFLLSVLNVRLGQHQTEGVEFNFRLLSNILREIMDSIYLQYFLI